MIKLRSLLFVLLPVATACARDSTPSDEEPNAPPPPAETRPVDRSDDPNVIVFEPMETAKDVPFAIPNEALGFNVVVEDPTADSRVDAIGIERIVAPDGTIVHDRFMPRGGNHATSISSVGRMATAGVPMGEAVPKWLGGTWTMRVAIPNDATKVVPVRAMIHIQATGSTFRGGVLDVHVHVPRGLNATAADGNDAITRRLDGFFDTWDRLFGIGRGRVTMFEEDASLESIDDIEEGTALASARAAPDPRALQILVTRKITARKGDVKGYTPAIPGAAGMLGAALSGIIVVLTESLDDDVNTLVHEAGHFFGLNHTTELDGEATDPLSDTPSCIMGGSFDRCADRSNLMFAVGAIAKPIVVSEMQKRVVRGSPLYRAF